MQLPSEYQSYIHRSRYARWGDDKKRRETWEETVERYIDYFKPRIPDEDASVIDELRQYILSLKTMPSMRALMTSGEALERDNVAGFNCSYLAMNRQRAFDELCYVLMCGTGVGFSVERKVVSQLPFISEEFHESDTVITVADSKIGWATAYKELISLLYSGNVPKWDMSKVRPAGAVLKTFGGRASGPEPLEDLFKYTVNTMRRFAGQQLPPIAVHDIVCKIAEIVVVGGVRRSALISLSDLDDEYMRVAKSPVKVLEYALLDTGDRARKYSVTIDDAPYGERSLILELDDWESGELQSKHTINWWHAHPERALANNSISYTERPPVGTFMNEWSALYESHSGERGVFNREAAQKLSERSGRRDCDHDFGTNPCSEIVLRDRQFCNLTEVVVRQDDSFEVLQSKVRIATILGTMQASLTDFRYLSRKWRQNTEEEALLGVSLTGIMDHPVLNGGQVYHQIYDFYGHDEFNKQQIVLEEAYDYAAVLGSILQELKEVAIETNREWADKLGIKPSSAITCVKPSGTVSQLVDSSSGIHPRHNRHYIRTVRGDMKDPLTQFMIDEGFPYEGAIGKEETTAVFSFPMTAPEGSIYRDDRTAIEQLELWKTYALHWCEHKPSITVYVKEEEWPEVGAWCWENFDILSGVSFLPFDGGVYPQAPYQDTTPEGYEEFLAKMPKDVDWGRLGEYEDEDRTEGTQTLACVAGSCEI